MTSLTLTGFARDTVGDRLAGIKGCGDTARFPGRTQRRAICGLRTEYSWHPVNLARSDQFLKPEIQANYIAAVTKRHNDVVGTEKPLCSQISKARVLVPSMKYGCQLWLA